MSLALIDDLVLFSVSSICRTSLVGKDTLCGHIIIDVIFIVGKVCKIRFWAQIDSINTPYMKIEAEVLPV